jgi:hypothetical protein
MQRNTSSASSLSWQASLQFHTQPNTAWRRHIAAIAACLAVASPSPRSMAEPRLEAGGLVMPGADSPEP